MAVAKTKSEEDQSCLIRFYKIVLSWDYIRLRKESEDNAKNKGGGTSGLNPVKDKYSDVHDYLLTFEPLLFEEVKAQIIPGSDEKDISVAHQKQGIITECSESEGFHFLELGVIHDVYVKETMFQNDLLLLSDVKFQTLIELSAKKKIPAMSSPTYAFAVVEHRQIESLRLRLFLHGEVKGTNVTEAESSQRLVDMNVFVRELKRLVYISKICSLSTIIREFVALQSIASLPFKDLILKASDCDSEFTDRGWKIPAQLMQYIENSHNASQLEAINAGLSRKSFVLIQGPPGTGKTQTILGLLSGLLHSTPARLHTKFSKCRQQLCGQKQWPESAMSYKYQHWTSASPWLTGKNERDMVMPIDGDDGFFPITGNEMKPEVVNSSRKYRVRVLVCAPSNSALDEIVLRVINRGIHDENDHVYNPKVVRIGLKAHHSVQSVSLDYLVEQKLAGIGDYLTADKQKQGPGAVDRDSIRTAVLNEAVIVFSTLSFSGSSIFSKLNRTFDVVIIDEAAQAIEPATLVPLSSGCKQVFLVGDPVQLPATVISPTAEKLGYGMSLFKRFQRAGYPVVMLKTQYRMHPEIRTFPSKEFYADALEDGTDIEDQTKRSWHDYRCFGPFCFFDIHESEESQPSGRGSWINVDEVEFVLLLYQKLVARYPELKSTSMLAIISPYRNQVKLLRERFREMFGVESDKFVDINTIDGFQGREKDVTIFSCVRSNKVGRIGFVADFRRMNVGITRARSSVLVVGSASTLKKQDEHWSNLVESAEKRDCLFQVSKPYASFFLDDNLKEMEVRKNVGEFEDEMDIDGLVYGNPDEADENYYGGGDDDGSGYAGVDDD